MPKIGSKLQVWNGIAEKTSGGLTKHDLMKNKRGKIVSKKKSEAGKKMFKENNLRPKTADELSKMRKKKA